MHRCDIVQSRAITLNWESYREQHALPSLSTRLLGPKFIYRDTDLTSLQDMDGCRRRRAGVRAMADPSHGRELFLSVMSLLAVWLPFTLLWNSSKSSGCFNERRPLCWSRLPLPPICLLFSCQSLNLLLLLSLRSSCYFLIWASFLFFHRSALSLSLSGSIPEPVSVPECRPVSSRRSGSGVDCPGIESKQGERKPVKPCLTLRVTHRYPTWDPVLSVKAPLLAHPRAKHQLSHVGEQMRKTHTGWTNNCITHRPNYWIKALERLIFIGCFLLSNKFENIMSFFILKTQKKEGNQRVTDCIFFLFDGRNWAKKTQPHIYRLCK